MEKKHVKTKKKQKKIKNISTMKIKGVGKLHYFPHPCLLECC
jgi:hypothetical protein